MTMMKKEGLYVALVAAMGITTSTAFYLPGVNPLSFADGDVYVYEPYSLLLLAGLDRGYTLYMYRSS
jgi:hypothetical protein